MNYDKDDFNSSRRQAILANPEGTKTSAIVQATLSLDDDEREQWLRENPEVHDELMETFRAIIEPLRELFEMVPDEVIKEYNRRVEFELDTGLYENVTLETADGVPYQAGLCYLWAKCLDGTWNLDIRERHLPEGINLVGSRVEIRNGDGIVLLAGEIVKEGGRMGVEGSINSQTVVLEPCENNANE